MNETSIHSANLTWHGWVMKIHSNDEKMVQTQPAPKNIAVVFYGKHLATFSIGDREGRARFNFNLCLEAKKLPVRVNRSSSIVYHRCKLRSASCLQTSKSDWARGSHSQLSSVWHRDQVWSLTQFYSVDFSKSRISVKKCVFNKRTIKVCVSCC